MSSMGKESLKCNISNHFSSVYQQKDPATANALIPHIHYYQGADIFSLSSITTNTLPDGDTCLAGPKHLNILNISSKDLIPSKKIVTAVRGHHLTCRRWLPIRFIRFIIGTHSTTQPL